MIPIIAKQLSTSSTFIKKLSEFFAEYNMLITLIAGGGMLLSITIFVYHLTKLYFTREDKRARGETIKNLLITGICLSLTAIVSTIVIILKYIAVG